MPSKAFILKTGDPWDHAGSIGEKRCWSFIIFFELHRQWKLVILKEKVQNETNAHWNTQKDKVWVLFFGGWSRIDDEFIKLWCCEIWFYVIEEGEAHWALHSFRRRDRRGGNWIWMLKLKIRATKKKWQTPSTE